MTRNLWSVVFLFLLLVVIIVWFLPKQTETPALVEGINTSKRLESSVHTTELNTRLDLTHQSEQTAKTVQITQKKFQQAQQARLCRNIPKTDLALSRWLDKANEHDESNAYIADVIQRYDECSQLETINISYVQLFKEAAEQGNAEAALEYWNITELEYLQEMQLQELNREQLISLRKLLNTEKYLSLHQTALAGSEQSLELLIKGYQQYDPETGLPSPYKALAYADFALQVVTDNDIYRKVDWHKQKMLPKLSDKELQEAEMFATSLSEQSKL